MCERVRLSATPCTVAPHAPLSMGFSRQEYWSGLSCPPPGDLPSPESNPRLLHLHWQAGSLPLRSPGKPLATDILVTHSFPALLQLLPGSSDHGISQAKILEWVSISLENLPDPGIKSTSPAGQEVSLPLSRLGLSVSILYLSRLLLIADSP